MRWPWTRKPVPKPPDYWHPADRVALVWRFGQDGAPSQFYVEAPTAEEATAYARAASATGQHTMVNAHLTPRATPVRDPLEDT